MTRVDSHRRSALTRHCVPIALLAVLCIWIPKAQAVCSNPQGQADAQHPSVNVALNHLRRVASAIPYPPNEWLSVKLVAVEKADESPQGSEFSFLFDEIAWCSVCGMKQRAVGRYRATGLVRGGVLATLQVRSVERSQGLEPRYTFPQSPVVPSPGEVRAESARGVPNFVDPNRHMDFLLPEPYVARVADGLRGPVKEVHTHTFPLIEPYGRSALGVGRHTWKRYDERGEVSAPKHASRRPECDAAGRVIAAYYPAPQEAPQNWPESSATFEYDALGRVIKQESFSPNGTPSGKTVFAYDADGLGYTRWVNLSGSSPGTRLSARYDPASRTSELVSYDEKNPESKETYVLNDKGDVVEERRYWASTTSAEGKTTYVLESESRVAYEYDEFGNWIKRTSSSKVRRRAEGGSVTYRTITYVVDGKERVTRPPDLPGREGE
jgi:hypothetical protein